MSKSTHPIRIQLIENIPINKAGLYCLLDSEPDFEVIQHVQCDQGCNYACAQDDFDVLLMVLSSSSRCGIECVQQIAKRHPDENILVLCMIDDPYLAKRILELGAKGVICKHTPPSILFRAIRNIAAGESYIDTDIARAIASLNNSGESSPFAALTIREYEIARLLLNGFNQRDIGQQLFISPHTVANHHTHILKKLNVSNHIELTKLAIRHGLTTT